MATLDPAGERWKAARRRAFGRDVWVNLVANVLTGALFWVVAQASGFIRGNSLITTISVAVLAGAVGGVCLSFAPPRTGKYAFLSAVGPLGFVAVIFGAACFNAAINPAGIATFSDVTAVTVGLMVSIIYVVDHAKQGSLPAVLYILGLFISTVVAVVTFYGTFIAAEVVAGNQLFP